MIEPNNFLNKNKKAQTQMIFIFTLAAIVIGLIIIMGYKGITSLTENSEKVMIDDFVNTLDSDIKSLERLKGSMKTKTYRLPTSVYKVCFIKSCSLLNNDCPSNLNPDILNSLPEENLVLLGKDDSVLRTEKFTKITIDSNNDDSNDNNDEDFFCQDNKGKIKVKIKGLGDGVMISNSLYTS